MSMQLKKIELWNIKAHEHFLFEPDETGITSVSGPNGTGKSTIVDSLAWCLYGTKVNNSANKKLIRDFTSTKTHEIKVEVILEVNQIDYLVRRQIISDSGGAECNVYGRSSNSNNDEDFNHLSGPSITSSESYIKQILKMDEKGFLTAVLIQQKQVDQIIVANPRERGAVIEKLTGIQSVTNAIKMAKDESKEMSQAASVITVENTDEIREQIKEVKKTGKELEAFISNSKSFLESEGVIYSGMVSEFKAEREKNENSKQLKGEIQVLKERVRNLNLNLEENTEIVTNHKKTSNTTMVLDINDLEKENASLRKISSQMEVEANGIAKEVLESTKRLEYIDKLKLDTKTEINKSLKKMKTNSENILKEINNIENEVSTLKLEKKQLNKSLSAIDEGESICPVCRTKIDDPKALREEMEKELVANKENMDKLKVSYEELREQSTSVLESLQEKENELLLRDEMIALKSKVKDLTKKGKVVNEKWEKANFDLEVQDKMYRESLVIQSKANEIKRAKENVLKFSTEVSNNNTLISEKEDELKKLKALTDGDLNKLRRTLEKKKTECQLLESEIRNKENEITFAIDKLNLLIKQYESAKVANEKYKKLTDSMTTASVSSKVLAEFKEERIKYAIPTLEMYSSSILAQFTEGKFTQMSIDSKFNTSVTNSDGIVRAIGDLSGGELSSAAIALRLGISMLLNEGENNVLILDEILVSMDAERAKHILETISSIVNCQIIFIAHNPDIQSIADKNVRVGQNP